jgi:conjugative relaxase-like TrwC/TraI family protein
LIHGQVARVAVLSIGKLGRGQENYYLNTVAKGVEDYYLGSGEAPGQWIGSGNRLLGLRDRVDPEALRAVLDGRHPPDQSDLLARRQSDRIPGFDLTFSAPKGTSLLFALAEPTVSAAIRRAHDSAVRQAVAYLEREAGEVRRGTGGRRRLPGQGFVAAAFRHRTSRAGDPQLHTHVLVANMTCGTDGRWTALDGQQLYLQAKTAGCLYQAALRWELRELGLAWTIRDNGMSELADAPRPVLRAFSQRRIDIEAALAERGASSRSAREVATLDTRKPKTGDALDLVTEWHARADELGFDAEARERILHTREVQRPTTAELQESAAHQMGPTGLTAQRSTFTRKEVLQAWCRLLPDGAPVATIERLTDQVIAMPEVVALDPPARRPTGAVRSAQRHSTAELLAVEADVLDRARRGLNAGLAICTGTLPNPCPGGTTLTADQLEATAHILTSGAALDVIVGKAGTGKTTTLAAARDAWIRTGVPVIGASVAARAARGLTEQAGIPATTVAALLHADPCAAIPGDGVLVVDEAGMLGTRDIARLLDACAVRRTKLVLVGDHRQLPEMTAGGAFAALARELDAAELVHNHRQRAAWEREALDELRDGDPHRAIEAYQAAGRISLGAAAARDSLVEAWWQTAIHDDPTGAAGLPPDPDALMLAVRRADVHELNQRARMRLRETGRLCGNDLVVPINDYAERRFAVGDLVVARRNDYRLGLINGLRGLVTEIDASTGVTIRVGCSSVRVPLDYITAGGLDHGYALTVHQAQGLTAERAYVAGGDALYREAGYVALSRARDRTELFLPETATYDDERERSHDSRQMPEDPLAALSRALARSRAQELAVDVADELTR